MGGNHFYMIYPVNFTKVMKMINHNRADQFISTHTWIWQRSKEITASFLRAAFEVIILLIIIIVQPWIWAVMISYCYSTLHPNIHPQRHRLTCLWPGFSTAVSIAVQVCIYIRYLYRSLWRCRRCLPLLQTLFSHGTLCKASRSDVTYFCHWVAIHKR